MEEEFDYITMGEEIEALRQSMTTFMSANDVARVYRDNYAITLIRRSSFVWDAEKLKKILSKGMMLKISSLVVNPDKIDDLVREGKIDRKQIERALTEKKQKPHVRVFPYKDGQSADDARAEEAALRAQLSNETVEASGSKRKKAS